MTQTSRLNIVFLITVLATLGASFILGFLSASVSLPIYARLVLAQIVLVAPALFYMKQKDKTLKKKIPNKGLSLGSIICLIGFMFAVQPLMTFFNYVSSLLFGSGTEELSTGLIQLPQITNVLFVALMPALLEEFVFRGIYFQGYRKHGFWKAMFISGLFFGLMHLNWNQFSYGFILGLLLAFLVEATGSIYASMIVHFGINYQSLAALGSYRKMTADEVDAALSQGEKLLYGGGWGILVVYGGYLFLAAAISLGVCALLIWLLARINQRNGYMEWIMFGGERRYLQSISRERIVGVSFAAAVIVPVILMCF